jgi:L-alanine-DL-glutamate epimerase-like enolase superfamily enzyme
VQKTTLRSDTGKIAIAVSSLFFKIVASTGQPRDRHKTGVNIAASLHFVAALPNTHYFEYCVEQGALRQGLTRQRFPVVDGAIAVPEEPGLGVELDDAVVARYRAG